MLISLGVMETVINLSLITKEKMYVCLCNIYVKHTHIHTYTNGDSFMEEAYSHTIVRQGKHLKAIRQEM